MALTTNKDESLEPAESDYNRMESDYNRMSELKAFDDTKLGVKGLVDTGLTKLPRFFRNPIMITTKDTVSEDQEPIPVIDLEGLIESTMIRRNEIVNQVREASETWGFFQIVNHGISQNVMDDMINGATRFYDQEDEKKKELYTRDFTKKFVYNSNFDLFNSEMASWRDTFFTYMAPNPPNPSDLPEPCRDEMILYTKEVTQLGKILFGLLSEALGLNRNHLEEMKCAEGLVFISHYYPACPEPEATMGTNEHTDNDFLKILLQDHVGGLQIRHEDRWLDVPPVEGALVVNIGDLLQLITNDKFKSAVHRVKANRIGPRVSVASFFSTSFQPSTRLYGPIKELLSKDNPPIYRKTTVYEYVLYLASHGIKSPLKHFRL